MTDAATQALRRTDRRAWLLALHRAGELREVRVECQECGGHGKLTHSVPHADGTRSIYRARRRCPACNGTGYQTHDGLELLAYVGDPDAREILGGVCRGDCNKRCFDSAGGDCARGLLFVGDTFTAWTKGLTRYGQEVCLRAAISAGLACTGSIKIPGPGGGDAVRAAERVRRILHAAREALRFAVEWLREPSEQVRAGWAERQVDVTELAGAGHWVPHPIDNPRILAQRIFRSARYSEDTARQVIREALTEWVLDAN